MHKLSQERCPTMMLQERAWSNVGGLEKIGPRKAANMLKRELNTDPDRSDMVVDCSFPFSCHSFDRSGWLRNARVQAIAGSCPKSHASAISGIRAWKSFAVDILGRTGNALPPTVAELLQWSRLFRDHRTFKNYCSYVKLACELQGVSVEVFAHPSLRRAGSAIKKRRLMPPRQPMFVRLVVTFSL